VRRGGTAPYTPSVLGTNDFHPLPFSSVFRTIMAPYFSTVFIEMNEY
jgi:hypothetical protein